MVIGYIFFRFSIKSIMLHFRTFLLINVLWLTPSVNSCWLPVELAWWPHPNQWRHSKQAVWSAAKSPATKVTSCESRLEKTVFLAQINSCNVSAFILKSKVPLLPRFSHAPLCYLTPPLERDSDDVREGGWGRLVVLLGCLAVRRSGAATSPGDCVSPPRGAAQRRLKPIDGGIKWTSAALTERVDASANNNGCTAPPGGYRGPWRLMLHNKHLWYERPSAVWPQHIYIYLVWSAMQS